MIQTIPQYAEDSDYYAHHLSPPGAPSADIRVVILREPFPERFFRYDNSNAIPDKIKAGRHHRGNATMIKAFRDGRVSLMQLLRAYGKIIAAHSDNEVQEDPALYYHQAVPYNDSKVLYYRKDPSNLVAIDTNGRIFRFQ